MPRHGMKQWTAARQQDIEEAYNDSASWTTLDEITRSHNYSFSSIAEWPVDGCLICAPTEKSALVLGKLASGLQFVGSQGRPGLPRDSGSFYVRR